MKRDRRITVSPTVKAIRDAIRQQGRRVTWVAEQIGVPRGTLAPMLSGHNKLRPDVAERAALLLGIPRTLVLEADQPLAERKRRQRASGTDDPEEMDHVEETS